MADVLKPLERGAVQFLRENWRNDGAEGESVHLVCDALETYAGKAESLQYRLNEDAGRAGGYATKANAAKTETATIRAALAEALDLAEAGSWHVVKANTRDRVAEMRKRFGLEGM